MISVYKPPASVANKSDIAIFPSHASMQEISTVTSLHEDTKQPALTALPLEDWASIADLTLLHDPYQPNSFRSGRWNTTSNPDLAFANLTTTLPQRIVLDPFPRSRHRSSLTTSYNPDEPIPQQKMLRDGTSARLNGNNLHTWWNLG